MLVYMIRRMLAARWEVLVVILMLGVALVAPGHGSCVASQFSPTGRLC